MFGVSDTWGHTPIYRCQLLARRGGARRHRHADYRQTVSRAGEGYRYARREGTVDQPGRRSLYLHAAAVCHDDPGGDAAIRESVIKTANVKLE